MDLIYTNSQGEDIGVLQNFNLDLAFGDSENNFVLTMDSSQNILSKNCLIYIDGTEYGGIVDGLKVSTKRNELTYNGRTWHGILNSKVIAPESGQNYYIVNGNANTVLSNLITKLRLNELFEVSSNLSDVTINNYSFDRYVGGYDGVMKMLKKHNAKLKIYFDNKVALSVVPIVNYAQDDEFDNSQLDFEIEQNYNKINHLICLGQGELASRQVVDLFIQQDGTVGTNPFYTGLNEVVGAYDYSAVESLEELIKGGTQKLLELNNGDKMKLDLDSTTDYDIGDIVGGREIVTGIYMAKPIVKKIVSIEKGKINIEHKVGE